MTACLTKFDCFDHALLLQARFPELLEEFEGDVDRVAARVAWDYMQVRSNMQSLLLVTNGMLFSVTNPTGVSCLRTTYSASCYPLLSSACALVVAHLALVHCACEPHLFVEKTLQPLGHSRDILVAGLLAVLMQCCRTACLS